MHTAKGREGAQVFLVEGKKSITQIASVRPDLIQEIVYSDTMKQIRESTCISRTVTQSQFRSICLSQYPAGPLAVVKLPYDYSSDTLPSLPGFKILVLEDIQDPGNLGTLIRCAAGFDFSGVICSDKCADPFAPKAVQASCGALASVWIRRTQHYISLLSALKDQQYHLVAADIGGRSWNRSAINSSGMVLILGNEGNGLLPATIKIADETVRIPFNEQKIESLNVAVSGAICMYLSNVFYRNAAASIF